MQLAAGSSNNTKPELVMEAFAAFMEIPYENLKFMIHRCELYADTGSDEARNLVSQRIQEKKLSKLIITPMHVKGKEKIVAALDIGYKICQLDLYKKRKHLFLEIFILEK